VKAFDNTSFYGVAFYEVERANVLVVVIFVLLQQLNSEDLGIFSIIIWSIWKHRNEKLWITNVLLRHNVFLPMQLILCRIEIVYGLRVLIEVGMLIHNAKVVQTGFRES
jgi:uncharacterized membrane protein